MSEMRRSARSLVETRIERFESRYGLEESKRRLEAALAQTRPPGSVHFTPTWSSAVANAVLEARFEPLPKTRRFLAALSAGMALLVAASAWAIVSPAVSGAAVFLLPLIAVLAVLGMPFLVLGLASARAADEARILRAVRAALMDEDTAFPPQQRWADED